EDTTDPAGADADEEAVGVDGDEVGHLGVDAGVALVDDPRPRVVVAARGFILEPGLDGPVAGARELQAVGGLSVGAGAVEAEAEGAGAGWRWSWSARRGRDARRSWCIGRQRCVRRR